MEQLISVKDYAEQKGVSFQSVYAHIKRHKRELEGHIPKENGKIWLDEEAVRILNAASGNSAPVIVQDAKVKEVEELKAENQSLRDELDGDRVALRSMTDTVNKLLGKIEENEKLVSESKLYLMQKEEIKKSNEQLRHDLEQEQSSRKSEQEELEKLKKELEELKNRGFFARLFNK
ncbi:MAG: hypothetical protein K6F77_01030 [Lachnospiraceae bacterium]|nr:hypothetical protein [Lachnospiraceae bacterium]